MIYLEKFRFPSLTKESSYIQNKWVGTTEIISNGESGLMYLSEHIKPNRLYLLDEPENSMSCEFQQKLAELIYSCAKYCNNQFIIATHSPFILAMDNVKIYNLDNTPVSINDWWTLDNMKIYFDFFNSFHDKFCPTAR